MTPLKNKNKNLKLPEGRASKACESTNKITVKFCVFFMRAL
jgi:hypothetical protein